METLFIKFLMPIGVVCSLTLQGVNGLYNIETIIYTIAIQSYKFFCFL